jgi:hypothetical protein
MAVGERVQPDMPQPDSDRGPVIEHQEVVPWGETVSDYCRNNAPCEARSRVLQPNAS